MHGCLCFRPRWPARTEHLRSLPTSGETLSFKYSDNFFISELGDDFFYVLDAIVWLLFVFIVGGLSFFHLEFSAFLRANSISAHPNTPSAKRLVVLPTAKRPEKLESLVIRSYQAAMFFCSFHICWCTACLISFSSTGTLSSQPIIASVIMQLALLFFAPRVMAKVVVYAMSMPPYFDARDLEFLLELGARSLERVKENSLQHVKVGPVDEMTNFPNEISQASKASQSLPSRVTAILSSGSRPQAHEEWKVLLAKRMSIKSLQAASSSPEADQIELQQH
jgi:hypothetical protein